MNIKHHLARGIPLISNAIISVKYRNIQSIAVGQNLYVVEMRESQGSRKINITMMVMPYLI